MSAYPIYDLALAVSARLKSQGVPVDVFHDSDRVMPSIPNAPTVKFVHDDDAGDSFDPAITTSQRIVENGLVKMIRGSIAEGVLVVITGASTKTGAGPHEDKGAVRRLAHEVFCACKVVIEADRMGMGETRGTFVPTSDGARQRGARYELRFPMHSGVFETIGITAASTTADPTVRGRSGLAEEIACGPVPEEP